MNTINPGFSPIPYNLLPSAEPDCQSKALALPAESKESAELETNISVRRGRRKRNTVKIKI